VIGYSASGIVTANTWNRISFTADLAAGTVKYYVNGNPVFTGGASLDGRHSLYSNLDGGPDLLLFNEGDSAAAYTHEVYLSSFLFTDRTMSAAEILALGGPKARGIFAPVPPITVSIHQPSTNLILAWSGGDGSYQVQKKNALEDIAWQNIANLTNETNLIVPPTGTAGFFRILGL